MSYFSNTLKTVLERRGWKQKDASAAFRLTSSTISQYLAGSRNPAKKPLAQILSALGESEQAEVIIAAMRDVVPSPEYQNVVQLTDATSNNELREQAAAQWRKIPLPKNVDAAMMTLAQCCAKRPEIGAAIIALSTVSSKTTQPK